MGAYKGDFALLTRGLWPGASVVCFEVLPEKIDILKALAQRDPQLHIFPMLLGEKNCDQQKFFEAETASSVLEEHMATHPSGVYPMRTLDYVVENYFSGSAPDLIKIDTQGYEFQILTGAEKTLQHCQVLLLEMNLIDIHKNVVLAGDLIAWLGQRQWLLHDICGLTRRPLDRALWQMDAVFVKKDSRFAQDKRWTAQ